MDPALTVAHARCTTETWTPDLDNAHLKDAARGLGSLAATRRPPRPIDTPTGTPQPPYAPR